MSHPLSRLRTSLLEHLPSHPRHKQSQLSALHSALFANSPQLIDTLVANPYPGISHKEAAAEFASALDTVRHFYDSVDAQKEYDEEYAVAKGRDNDRRVPRGIVVLRPGWYMRLWGVVVPVAAAIAAGNCVVVELPKENKHAIDDLLWGLLGGALDGNTFWPCEEGDEGVRELIEKGEGVIVVDQKKDAGRRVVAVVDRSADVEEAARVITRARFGFGGGSPYAPDLVLVNEYVKTNFFEACTRYATRAFADWSGREVEELGEVEILMRKEEEEKRVASFGGKGFQLWEVLDRDCELLTKKIPGRNLVIATCSSLVDAAFFQTFDKPFLAGYFFAEPASAKYLSQYIPSQVSCVSHIPTQILFGPAAPLGHAPDIAYRYNTDMFSLPRPQFVKSLEPTTVGRLVEELLDGNNAGKAARALQQLQRIAETPLKPTGEPKTLVRTDFFMSGVLLSAGIFASVALPAVGWASYLLGKGALGYYSRFRR